MFLRAQQQASARFLKPLLSHKCAAECLAVGCCGRLETAVEVSPMKTVKFFALAGLLALATGMANSAGRDIYPDPSHAKADLAAALKTAAATHRRVLLDFGGNWCGDCQVLDFYMHDARTSRFSRRILSWSTSTSATTMPIWTWPKIRGSAQERRARAGSPERARRAALQPEERRV